MNDIQMLLHYASDARGKLLCFSSRISTVAVEMNIILQKIMYSSSNVFEFEN